MTPQMYAPTAASLGKLSHFGSGISEVDPSKRMGLEMSEATNLEQVIAKPNSTKK